MSERAKGDPLRSLLLRADPARNHRPRFDRSLALCYHPCGDGSRLTFSSRQRPTPSMSTIPPMARPIMAGNSCRHPSHPQPAPRHRLSIVPGDPSERFSTASFGNTWRRFSPWRTRGRQRSNRCLPISKWFSANTSNAGCPPTALPGRGATLAGMISSWRFPAAPGGSVPRATRAAWSRRPPTSQTTCFPESPLASGCSRSPSACATCFDTRATPWERCSASSCALSRPRFGKGAPTHRREFNGGRWEVRPVEFLTIDPKQFTNADDLKAATMRGEISIGGVVKRFERPMIPAH